MLTNHQYGFRQNRSTARAIYDPVENKLLNNDKNNPGCAIYLDLQKCFDSVDREILINKLYRIGIRGPTLNLLRSYLTDRYQYTVVNGISSAIQLVEYGVPQGSTLGPLLFLIFVNDMPLISDKIMIKLFADDSLLYITGNDAHQIQTTIDNELPKIEDWFVSNKLTINASKTVYMYMGPRSQNTSMNIMLHDENLEQVDTVKYLGVTMLAVCK